MEVAEILRKHGKKVVFTQRMRVALDRADIATHTKRMFYDLSGGEETEEKVEAERGAGEDENKAEMGGKFQGRSLPSE